ncbi:hypothetical protein [Nocardia sp. BMG111209]|uniref:hypothetical protein n=1 Tax=Nocardia sp. BMG111209 TaxID=1160137 RepID=UPI0012DDFE63|nr:hypothetical protein [Nocardia sp. BMG111209]
MIGQSRRAGCQGGVSPVPLAIVVWKAGIVNNETLFAATVIAETTPNSGDRPVVVHWPDPSPLRDWWEQIMGIDPGRATSGHRSAR